MPTKRQLQKMREAEMEYPQIRRTPENPETCKHLQIVDLGDGISQCRNCYELFEDDIEMD